MPRHENSSEVIFLEDYISLKNYSVLKDFCIPSEQLGIAVVLGLCHHT